MSTRGAILISKHKGIGFYKHHDMYINGFLTEFIHSIKDFNHGISFGNIDKIFTNYISYHTTNYIKKEVEVFNEDIHNILSDGYYYRNDISIEFDMSYSTIMDYDIEYWYHFIEDEIRVYTIPIGSTVDYFVGSISYEDINNKSIEELMEYIATLNRFDKDIHDEYYYSKE